MKTLKDISKPIKQDLENFNDYFKNLMNTNVSLLNLVLRYITMKKGKQVRPLLVFLASRSLGGETSRTNVGAALVELLHTATLVHDDVVDAASERRGLASINAVWNNKVAVLIGDFLLSKGLLTSVETNEFDYLRVTSHAVRRMSEGELLAIDKSRSLEIDEETYFRIISDKTASLLSSCCEIGAVAASATEEQRIAFRNYGEYIGIAFQLRDDIMDYVSKSMSIGKPVGNDIKEKKITLPLIFAFQNADKAKVKKIQKLIKRGKLSKSEVEEILDFAKQSGGIEYTEKYAVEYIEKAKNEINFLDESDYKKSLIAFADFVLKRKA